MDYWKYNMNPTDGRKERKAEDLVKSSKVLQNMIFMRVHKRLPQLDNHLHEILNKAPMGF